MTSSPCCREASYPTRLISQQRHSFHLSAASTDDDDNDDLDMLLSDSDSDNGSVPSEPVAGKLGDNKVGGTIVGQSLPGSGGAPFQTDGGVIMPEGGANPCVIKVSLILFTFLIDDCDCCCHY